MWKPVPGFEDFYMVNENGDILSKRSGKLRKPVLNCKNGYLYVVLCGSDSKRTLPVHRIVASAFVNNQNNFDCVNHKNEIKTDNRVENLEWCTKRYNNLYNGKVEKCNKAVIQIDPASGEETYWKSMHEADRAGIASFKNISSCCRGVRNKAGGYMWRYA